MTEEEPEWESWIDMETVRGGSGAQSGIALAFAPTLLLLIIIILLVVQ